ncbi:GERMIN-LIKE PROTEIN [Salix purpurea]|uniref:Germin-like protein n=1 Tax=Salix purpurea TaxID=77065 RepID=A0A9Q0W999_SALPP|nr:GERMIN-LIKE PROTEIN [Salix purpurea]
MKFAHFLVALVVLALASSIATAGDPSPLQDFCVAINDPKAAGLNTPRYTGNKVGSNVTLLNVDQIAGLNTLGISLARIDYAPNGGLNPPHTHPRGTEILVVVEGTLYVGFVTSNPDNRFINKVLYPGDVFVQNPGTITIANAVFGSDPPISLDVLAKAFMLDSKIVSYLQKQFGGNNK